jgi:hypothetical protein
MAKCCKRAVQGLIWLHRTLIAAWLPHWQLCFFSFRVAAVGGCDLRGTHQLQQWGIP